VQRLVAWANDVWRHVGIVVEFHGHLWVIEAGRQGYRGRPLSTVLATYSRSSICRLHNCGNGCRQRIVDAALDLMDTPTTYPDRPELAVAGFLSLARRTERTNRGRWGSAARAVAGRHLDRSVDGPSTTLCAALAVRSLGHVCSQHSRFPNLASAKTGRADADLPDRLAGHYALPDDIWRMFESDWQYWVDDGRPSGPIEGERGAG
jgi:hypothetical protein